MAERKPFLCRIGMHQTFGDTLLRNIGTVTTPIYVMETHESCNRCQWTTRPAERTDR